MSNYSEISGLVLKWIQDNYKQQGIKSLAMSALGCGLGNLQWQDVGPLMCKFLKELDIQVCIYLPTDGKIADEFLTKEFLLSLK
ncbi:MULTISPECIES: hypothetical protein [Nostocales]|uniref:hypothetical protein n=1 Tax=Nostocales TaxID=1161 RepID=UPI001446FDBA|nr:MULTISPECIES: hypothetical protein [Nostocales]MBO1053197.1 hypothetical protein [Dolichospermum sp. DET73]MCE2698608.1 hypothetical protein [Anabaena sp. 49633_E8]MDJ0499764.1 hypothetical protein [Nostocales cyanobacterium LE14-WE4]QSV55845.1 MAG: hypothetical protein HEP80_20270 [Dolichospermum sp. UKL201]MCE2703783.1 hypothetical protein [Anabaena sp. 49633_E8]